MFCPKCASKNEDDVKFCRGCGCDISVVARSLKGHGSIVIASKIDQYFDRPDERMLRDSVIYFLIGIASALIIVWGMFTGGIPMSLLFFFLLPFGASGFCGGIWKALSYRQSLVRRSASNSNNLSQGVLYCPVCGNRNDERTVLCRKCGTGLEHVTEVFRKKSNGWFVDRLEQTISNYREKRSSLNIFAVIALGIFALVSGALEENPVFSIFGFMMASLFLIPGIWDLIVEKRRSGPADSKESVTETKTRRLHVRTHEELNPGNADAELDSADPPITAPELLDAVATEAKTKRIDKHLPKSRD